MNARRVAVALLGTMIAAAAQGGVVISSKLLNLARAVKPRGQP